MTINNQQSAISNQDMIRSEAIEWLLDKQEYLIVLNGLAHICGVEEIDQRSPRIRPLLSCMMEYIQRILKVVADLPEYTVVDSSLFTPLMLLLEECEFIVKQSKMMSTVC